MSDDVRYVEGDKIPGLFAELAAKSEEILLAMAFVSPTGMAALQDEMLKTLNKKTLNLRVILNRQFAPTREMREAIVVRLRQLGAEVRIAQTPRMFHAKLYLFRSRGGLSAICGSANLTTAAFAHNVELSNVALNLPSDTSENLTDWFAKHWETSKTVTDASFADLISAGLEIGEPVSVPDLGRTGVISDPGSRKLAFEHHWVSLSKDEQLELAADQLELISPPEAEPETCWLVAYRALSGTIDIEAVVEESRISLYAHQSAPLLAFLAQENPGRLLVADEVGLGKTITAGLFLAGAKKLKGIRSVLIVCPKDLIEKWIFELKSKFGLDLKALEPQEWQLIEKRGLDCAVTAFHIANYELIRSRVSNSCAAKYDLVISDEVHRCRNASSQTFKALQRLSSQSQYFLGLSATPIQTEKANLESVMAVIDPNVVEGEVSIAERILLCRAARETLLDGGNAEILRRAVMALENPAPAMRVFNKGVAQLRAGEQPTALGEWATLGSRLFRTTKSDIGPAIPRKIHNVFAVLNEAEEIEYRAGKEQAGRGSALRGVLWERLYSSYPTLAHSLTQKAREAQQIFSEWENSQSQGDTDTELRAFGLEHRRGGGEQLTRKEEKLVALCRAMAKNNQQAIIFCNFVATSRRLAAVLVKQGMRVKQMDGQTPTEIRAQHISALKTKQADFLVSTSIGGEGLDLQFMDTVINFDLPWNPMVLEQRAGRIDRIGQKAPLLHVYNFFVVSTSKGFRTVDRRLLDVLLHRLSEVGMHLGGIGAVLTDPELQDPLDEILRSANSVRLMNEWLPAVKAASFRDASRFQETFRRRLLPPKFIEEFVASVLPQAFPGTIVRITEGYIAIKPSVGLQRAVVQEIESSRRLLFPELITGVWFCTAERDIACANPSLVFLSPKSSIIVAAARIFLGQHEGPRVLDRAPEYQVIAKGGTISLQKLGRDVGNMGYYELLDVVSTERNKNG